MRVALTIAGSDSSGGAGIQADLKTFQAYGVFGMSAVTAVTVQNTQKVHDIQEIDPAIVARQVTCIFEDTPVDAVKIGMVSSVDLIRAIAGALADRDLPPVVLDPVMISKSGYPLLKKDAQSALALHLFPLARVVTPNLFEARLLAGFEIISLEDMQKAARRMIDMGARQAVIKGGHFQGEAAVDVLFDGRAFKMLSAPKIETRSTHGTGCTFSSALAAGMALGMDFFDAAARAKAYVTQAIVRAPGIGKGSGPLNHMVAP